MRECFQYETCEFSKIRDLLESNHVQIDSPSGYVDVSEYVDKGMWDEYLVSDIRGNNVRVNENHLFYTQRGWVLTRDLVRSDSILKDDGRYHLVIVEKTGHQIPIVDIVVDSDEHEYYANGFTSHNTNVGKTLFMVHMASGYLRKGKNVLYITLEMAEEEIAKRVDANNFDMPIGKVDKISRDKYDGAIQRIRSKTNGKLIIKQFPTGSAHVGHFRTLLQELWLKKNFKPDAIVVDYIGICASSRMKMGNTSSYFYIKAVAEELRGLGIEFEVPVWTAVQTTRTGFSSNDVDITDTAESFGLPATADLMLAAMRTDELDKLNQMIMKQLKNRYANKNVYTKFLIGSEFEKQKLFDVDNNAQEKLNDHNSPDDDDGLSDQEADPTSNRKRLTKRKKNKFKDYD